MRPNQGTLHENDDMPTTRREMRSQIIGRYVGENGAGHDQTRDGQASRRREGHGDNAQRGSQEVGRRNEAKMGCGGANLSRTLPHCVCTTLGG